jgi:hypothetical protein
MNDARRHFYQSSRARDITCTFQSDERFFTAMILEALGFGGGLSLAKKGSILFD